MSLVCSFICAVFLCLFFSFFKIIVFEVSFSQASRKVELFSWRRLNSFFVLVSDLLRLVQWFVWASDRVKFVLSFCLLGFFPSNGQGWMRWYSWLLMIGFVFLFCLSFRWGILHRVILVVGWCWVLYSSAFLCVSSHYLILPRVSSLVVYALGVSAPTPKAQGLISGHKWRFCKWFVMALRKSKTNIQKRWTPNGSYKIRQILIKIMEYTHIHIYPWAKWKQPNKNKVL